MRIQANGYDYGRIVGAPPSQAVNQYLNQYHPIIKCEMPISCQYICQYQPTIKCEMQNYETKELIYLKF